MIITTPNGAAFSAGGVSSTLRDLARYGMLFTDGVRAEGDRVISDAPGRAIGHLRTSGDGADDRAAPHYR